MPTDTSVSSLIINKLTKAQYDDIQNPSETELYLVEESIDTSPTQNSTNPVQSGGVYTALAGKQATLASQTAYTSKGSATKVPQITTNALGQVTSITEVDITHPDGLTSLNESIANIIDGEEYADIGYFGSAGTSVIEFQSNGIALAAASGLDSSGIQLAGDTIYIYAENLGITISSSGVLIGGETVATQEWVGGQGYLTSHQDISGKEDKVDIVSASGATLSAEVGKYYTLSNVGTLAITLPTIASGTTKVQTVTFYIAAGSTPAVTFTSTHSIYYSDGFEIAASSTYEVSAAYNGIAWVVASVKIVIPT